MNLKIISIISLLALIVACAPVAPEPVVEVEEIPEPEPEVEEVTYKTALLRNGTKLTLPLPESSEINESDIVGYILSNGTELIEVGYEFQPMDNESVYVNIDDINNMTENNTIVNGTVGNETRLFNISR